MSSSAEAKEAVVKPSGLTLLKTTSVISFRFLSLTVLPSSSLGGTLK